ncbi:hypothetical protein JCM33374_g1169 [Metschnikowia sp. JCM 33374]|nr:hypothetical protein JCM33374_g1169 [Metschnikowia sp. JCM 33374]
MLLGSEQFLKSDNDPVYSVCDVTSTDISDGDTDPIENVTVDELQPIDDGTRNQPIMRPPQNGLMSLLSGNQTTKRPPKRRKKKSPVDDEKKDTPKEASRSEAEVEASYVSDISDVPDTSFDVSEFERKAEKIQAIEDLEKRMFSSGKTVSVRDFLTKKKPPSSPNNINEPVDVITISEVNSSPEIIAIDDEEKPAVEDLELLFPASKSVNARNLFDSFGPKRTKKANGEWSLKVSLKISPDKIGFC